MIIANDKHPVISYLYLIVTIVRSVFVTDILTT